MEIDTRTVKNFLTDQELDTIEQHVLANGMVSLNYNDSNVNPPQKVLSGTYYCFEYYNIGILEYWNIEINKLINYYTILYNIILYNA